MKKILVLALIHAALAALTGCAASQPAECLECQTNYERGYSAGYQAAADALQDSIEEAANAVEEYAKAAEEAANLSNIYPRCGVIIYMDYEEDLVTVEDAAGLFWKFSGCEDYELGDIVLMLMQEAGEPNYILDDFIIHTEYGGYVEGFANILG